MRRHNELSPILMGRQVSKFKYLGKCCSLILISAFTLLLLSVNERWQCNREWVWFLSLPEKKKSSYDRMHWQLQNEYSFTPETISGWEIVPFGVDIILSIFFIFHFCFLPKPSSGIHIYSKSSLNTCNAQKHLIHPTFFFPISNCLLLYFLRVQNMTFTSLRYNTRKLGILCLYMCSTSFAMLRNNLRSI